VDYAALGTAFLAWLKEVSPWVHDALIAVAAMITQKKLDEGNDAKDTMAAVKRADDAAGKPVDVLRDLQSRGRVRDL
jgi:hypothetical protein